MIQANEDTRQTVTIREPFNVSVFYGSELWDTYFFNGDAVMTHGSSRATPDGLLEAIDDSPECGTFGVWYWRKAIN